MEKSDCTRDSLFVAMVSLSMPLANLSRGEIYSCLSMFLIANSETHCIKSVIKIAISSVYTFS